MSKYTAPQHTQRRRSLSRRTRIILVASVLIPVSLLAIAKAPVSADASNNPVFATLQDVQNAINAALAPIQSAIASLQQQQTAQATQISNLQNSISSKPLLLDANGQTLGIFVEHNAENSGVDTVYNTTLNKFIGIADNDYFETHSTPSGSGISDIASPLSFQSPDCTGTPYYDAYSAYANNVMSFSPGVYYEFHPPEQPTETTQGSLLYWNSTNDSTNCVPDPQSHVNGWQLYPVILPFTTPIAEPVQFKYQ